MLRKGEVDRWWLVGRIYQNHIRVEWLLSNRTLAVTNVHLCPDQFGCYHTYSTQNGFALIVVLFRLATLT